MSRPRIYIPNKVGLLIVYPRMIILIKSPNFAVFLPSTPLLNLVCAVLEVPTDPECAGSLGAWVPAPAGKWEIPRVLQYFAAVHTYLFSRVFGSCAARYQLEQLGSRQPKSFCGHDKFSIAL